VEAAKALPLDSAALKRPYVCLSQIDSVAISILAGDVPQLDDPPPMDECLSRGEDGFSLLRRDDPPMQL